MADRPLTRAEQDAIAHHLNGTCKSEDEAIAAFADEIPGLNVDDVNEAAQVGEIERCGLCSWWDESSNFNSNGNCLDCEEDDGEG